MQLEKFSEPHFFHIAALWIKIEKVQYCLFKLHSLPQKSFNIYYKKTKVLRQHKAS